MSGEAKVRKLTENERFTFDFTAPKVIIGRKDRDFLAAPMAGGGDDDAPEVRAVKHTMSSIVQASGQKIGGLKGADATTWALWQAGAIDTDGDALEVTRAMFDWFWSRAKDDDLALPAGLSQWKVAVVEYCRELREALKAEPAKSAESAA